MDLITQFLNDPTFWVMIAFVIFVGALARPISGAITAGLDKRADKIHAELEEAEKLREEAQDLLASYQRQQRDAVKVMTSHTTCGRKVLTSSCGMAPFSPYWSAKAAVSRTG